VIVRIVVCSVALLVLCCEMRVRVEVMRVEVMREGERVQFFETPEAITEAPLRTDRLTYSYSNSFDSEFQSLFGDRKLKEAPFSEGD
jgi:hypothetical protein